MAFIKRSEVKIVSIVETEEMDEKQKQALLTASTQLQEELQTETKKDQSKGN
jgi:hypothetical protein